MKIIKASYEARYNSADIVRIKRDIETAARTCYKSEENISIDSSNILIGKLINLGHEAMLEHGSISVKFITDRAIANEIVRHRLFSYAQESTRYCNYSKSKFSNEITVINPYNNTDTDLYNIWEQACLNSERAYFELLKQGEKPELARNILPLSLKTEIVVTGNIREWRHFFKLRCDKKAHPQMRELVFPLLSDLANNEYSKILFYDIYISLFEVQ